MNKNDVPDVNISDNSLASLFGIEYMNGKYEFRSNKTLIINGSKEANQEMYELYKISDSDSWASISHNFYNTTELWWIICKFNGIVNPNMLPRSGNIIMIPKKEIVDFILREIKNSGSKN